MKPNIREIVAAHSLLVRMYIEAFKTLKANLAAGVNIELRHDTPSTCAAEPYDVALGVDAMAQAVRASGVLRVSNLHNSTLYERGGNEWFRTVHDMVHLLYGLGFSPDDEDKVHAFCGCTLAPPRRGGPCQTTRSSSWPLSTGRIPMPKPNTSAAPAVSQKTRVRSSSSTYKGDCAMRQHEGIVVVAYKPGQPASQVQADLMLADIGDFTTSMVHLSEGHYGIGCKVNRIDEASALLMELQDAGFSAAVLKGATPADGWRVV